MAKLKTVLMVNQRLWKEEMFKLRNCSKAVEERVIARIGEINREREKILINKKDTKKGEQND